MSSSVEQNGETQDDNNRDSAVSEEDSMQTSDSVEMLSANHQYTLTQTVSMADATYVPGYYAPYVTYSSNSATADVWSGHDPSSYYASYMSSAGAAMYDYTGQSAGYGWYPGVDYSWTLGMANDATGGMYTPEGYYTVESYSNGDVDVTCAAGDAAQYGMVDQSMKSLSLSDRGADMLNPMFSNHAKAWAVFAGQSPGGFHRGRKMYPHSADAHVWNSSPRHAAMYDRPAALPYRVNRLNGFAGKPETTTNSVVQQLQAQHDYNPTDFDLNPKSARFFVIKSYSEDDVHRSIKYGIWCSTDYGNKRLDTAYQEREGKGQIYLFFSVNGSGHFCGVAEMTSAVDYQSSAGFWAQDKWKGKFTVRWIYVKDVPNSQLRHIRLENNEGKPVTNSRDTQEVPADKGRLVLSIIHHYKHTTSIFDDFSHYEKRQEETAPPPSSESANSSHQQS